MVVVPCVSLTPGCPIGDAAVKRLGAVCLPAGVRADGIGCPQLAGSREAPDFGHAQAGTLRTEVNRKLGIVEDGSLTRDQLIRQIRFALSELPARNGHHEFEEACRHLAHARIAVNILPATGPVSSGGDQGRDFETFHSYLAETLSDRGWFTGLVPSGSIVGLCTLQKGSVAGKVLNDVEKICFAGQPPERIYAFLGADMPVAQRHKLIEEAKDKYHVELEVLDANAIAEQLCDFDTYWIAVCYLSLPEQFAPSRPTTDGPGQPEWYIDLLSYWRKPDSELQSLADLISIREGLRRATFHPDSRADLPFWLDLVRPLADQNADRDLLQRARYEMVVASIRGLGDLRAVDTLADMFLSASVETTDPSRLEDASVVLSYTGTAASIGHSDLDLGVLGDHRRALRSRAAELLADDPPPVRRTRLLQVAGHLALSPDGARLSRDTEDRSPSQVAMLDQPREPIAPPEAVAMSDIVDVDDALMYWTELAMLIADTPLFPVEDFAEIVQYLTPVLIDADGWEDLATALDNAVGRVAGAARVGEGCRDRGVALREAGRPLDALHEIHRAKLEWWTGDTLRGALLAMTFIAQLYRDLKLPLAAKQYALAVAGAAQSVGDDDVADLVPTGMLLASEISYQAGDWLAALEELEIGVIAMHALGQEGSSTVTNMAMRATVTAAMCLRGARELSPDLVGPVEIVLERIGLLDVVTAALEDTEPMTSSEWRENCDRDLLGRPFADAGERYSTRFAALGTRWTISCPNEYPHVRATQRLAAALQVTLVELAAVDLCLMPSAIEVAVIASRTPPADTNSRVVALPTNEGRRWQIELTEYVSPVGPADLDEAEKELLATITAFLLDVSLLPLDEYMAAMGRGFQRGLGHKLVAGRPYDELAEIVPQDRFAATARHIHRPPLDQDPSPPAEHPDLTWQSAPGPGFSLEKAAEMAANRYEKISSLLSNTLPKLATDKEFQRLVERLRSEDWLDWHILVGVYNVAANYRLAEAGLNTSDAMSTRAGQQAARELMVTPAIDQGDPIPLDIFDEEAVRTGRRMGIDPLIVHWGLQSRQMTPDYPAVERVLAVRYGYWSIDADHSNPFASTGA